MRVHVDLGRCVHQPAFVAAVGHLGLEEHTGGGGRCLDLSHRPVTETPAGISAAPLQYRHIPLTGAPVSAHGRAACHPMARVCVPLDAAVTRVTCTCPARRGPARRGCHSCDATCGTNFSVGLFSSMSLCECELC